MSYSTLGVAVGYVNDSLLNGLALVGPPMFKIIMVLGKTLLR